MKLSKTFKLIVLILDLASNEPISHTYAVWEKKKGRRHIRLETWDNYKYEKTHS